MRLGKVKNKNYVFYLSFHSPFTIFAFIYYVMIENVYGIINK